MKPKLTSDDFNIYPDRECFDAAAAMLRHPRYSPGLLSSSSVSDANDYDLMRKMEATSDRNPVALKSDKRNGFYKPVAMWYMPISFEPEAVEEYYNWIQRNRL